ncbi:hypothetical protein P148_SR1C00001G0783 [candidate division SR1 bacterium RAAC1_SR1_1]|nr:hypothetical protein P148_SR1C00001G0783 [candidate division SR1 bacterium RAAC1_SR1_1]
MMNTINVCENNVLTKETWDKIINLLVNKANLDRNYVGKNRRILKTKELKEIFISFEKNYEKIRKHFKNGEYTFPENFDDFKKISLGKCQEKYGDYKHDLFQELSINNKKEFASLIDKEKFLYLCSETSSTVWDNLLGEIENKEILAKSLNKVSNKELKNLIYIINNTLNDSKKITIVIDKLGDQISNFLTMYDKENIVKLIKKMEIKDIKHFFDIKNYGNKQLEITLYIEHIEKIIDIIQYMGSQVFLVATENIDTKMLAELIDRTATKELGKALLNRNKVDERKPENIKGIIKEINSSINKK